MIKEMLSDLLTEARKPHRPCDESIQEVILSGQ